MYFKSPIRHSGNILAVYRRETVGNRSLNRTWNSLRACALYIKTQSKNQISHAYKEKQRKCFVFFQYPVTYLQYSCLV